jgi:hypothetical protein
MSWCLVPSALKGFQLNKFLSDIRDCKENTVSNSSSTVDCWFIYLEMLLVWGGLVPVFKEMLATPLPSCDLAPLFWLPAVVSPNTSTYNLTIKQYFTNCLKWHIHFHALTLSNPKQVHILYSFQSVNMLQIIISLTIVDSSISFWETNWLLKYRFLSVLNLLDITTEFSTITITHNRISSNIYDQSTCQI